MVNRLRIATQRRRGIRPDWDRLESDHEYFSQVLARLFEAHGYSVLSVEVNQDANEQQARECMILLSREGRLHVAVGLRWLLTVTSDVVGRFGRALPITRASGGILITTSLCTDAALQSARGLSIQLLDRHQFWQLIEDVWPMARPRGICRARRLAGPPKS